MSDRITEALGKSVDESKAITAQLDGVAATPVRAVRTEAALRSVGLWEHRSKRPPQMSGGQRQRVAIARAIAKRPNVIIADEPTASLDQKTGREIMEILVELSQKKGVSVVIASHDLMVHSYAEYHYQVLDGQVSLQEGKSR